jgi:hypothetical protein
VGGKADREWDHGRVSAGGGLPEIRNQGCFDVVKQNIGRFQVKMYKSRSVNPHKTMENALRDPDHFVDGK